MEKQDVPLTKEKIEEKTNRLFFGVDIILTFFYAVLFASVGLLLLSVSYLLVLQSEFNLAFLNFKLLKLLIMLWVMGLVFGIIRFIYQQNLMNKMRNQERQKKIKEEIRQEILKELKNGRKR